MKGRRLWIYLVTVCWQLEVCEWNQGKALKKVFVSKQILFTYKPEETTTSHSELEAHEKRVAFQLCGRWEKLEKK